ncbi:MAG: CpaF family protein, partial [Phycisphaerae bacterium]|nr:CpaF family protein [Phycisphaerae bacterium]
MSAPGPSNTGLGKTKTLTGLSATRLKQFQELKTRIHRKMVDRLDLSNIEGLDKEDLRKQIRAVVAELCDEENTLLNYQERERLMAEVLDETFGLGPLEVLLADPTITDILVNGPHMIYIERRGRLEKTEVSFKDNTHLLHIIDKIVSKIGRRCDEVSPMVDARLQDGSRVNAIIPPLALDGPALSIRRFGTDPVRIQDLLDFKSITQEMVDFLSACVRAKLNIMIVGGTGSGKTTLLNNLSSFIPDNERIVTIEDAAELILQQPHVVRLETRPPNIEGKGQITQRDLLRNCLRMRPDRIIVGEVRGSEALDMLQAMNTGHEGSMTTIHANSTRDALSRLETMVTMAGFELPVVTIRQQFAAAVNVVVQASRLKGGRRRVMSISEVLGMEGDMVTM